MRKIYLLTTLLITALIIGCNNDVLVEEVGITDNTETASKTIKISTTMPGESNSRIAMELAENELDVNLTWKDGDEINLIFVEGGIAVGKQTVKIEEDNISPDRKRASFDITVNGVTGDEFDIYGVHGGGGFASEESYELLLPTAAESMGTSLDELSSNNAIMIRFEAKDVSLNSPNISVEFEHIGSLFRLELKNKLTVQISEYDFNVSLVSESAIGAHQNNGNATYNPMSKTVINSITNQTSLPFASNLKVGEIPVNTSVDFWAWYIPDADAIWDKIGLEIANLNESLTYESTSKKSARTAPIPTGKAFHFYAAFMDWKLHFTNSAGEIGDFFTDTRDNNIYKYVIVGNQAWMAENLRYIPEDATLGDSYRIMNYNGTDIEEAKVTDEYNTFGVYYNWITAVAGTDNSSGKVQGVCPDGWHLPIMSEVATIVGYVTNGNLLKKAGAEFWYTNNGTDDYGFAALGGGYYENDELKQHKVLSALWTSFPQVGNISQANYFHIGDDGLINTELKPKANYLNVRCIRDTSSGGVDH